MLIRSLTFAMAAMIVAAQTPTSTLPAEQNFSAEFQAQLPSADAGSAAFYIQTSFSRDAAGANRAAVYGLFGWAFSPRDIVVTGVELRRGETVVRPGMAPRTPIRGQGGFSGGGTVVGAVGVLAALLSEPESVEVRILTEDRPEGLYRGTLKRASVHYLAAFTEGAGASGYEVFLASVTRNAEGRIDSAMIQNQLSLVRGPALVPTRGVFPWRVAVLEGARGATGPMLADFGNPSNDAASVPGYPGSEMRGIDVSAAARRDVVERLVERPSGFYVNVSGTEATPVQLRAQLRPMDRAIFYTRLGGQADTTLMIEADFTRDEFGTVNSGLLYNISDWGTAAAVGQVRSINLHLGGPGESAPASATIATPDIAAPVGRFLVGGLAVLPGNETALTAFDRLINYPDLTHITAVTAAGNLRAQTFEQPGVPVIESIGPASGGDGPLAPGMRITIRGRRLAKVTSGLDAFDGARIPEGLNGALVEVNGKPAAILFVSPARIEAQLPMDTPLGESAVAVNHGTAASEDFRIRVAPRNP